MRDRDCRNGMERLRGRHRGAVSMPFSVRVIGFSVDTGQASLNVEPPWWNARRLTCDPRFEESNLTGSYRDFNADLSADETRALNEEFRSDAQAGIVETQGSRNTKDSILQELDEALYSNPKRYSHFRVHVYEWET